MNKKAFTLVELVVVLIIIGTLAAVSIPLLFQKIHRSHASEALETMGLIRRAMEVCGASNNYDFTKCLDWDSIKITDPSNSAGNGAAKFNYVTQGQTAASGATDGTYQVIARDYDDANTYIAQTRNSDGSITCSTASDTGTNVYNGVC